MRKGSWRALVSVWQLETELKRESARTRLGGGNIFISMGAFSEISITDRSSTRERSHEPNGDLLQFFVAQFWDEM